MRPFSPEEIRWVRDILHWGWEREDNEGYFGGADWYAVSRMSQHTGRSTTEIWAKMAELYKAPPPRRYASPRLVAGVMIDDYGLLYRELMTEIYAAAA